MPLLISKGALLNMRTVCRWRSGPMAAALPTPQQTREPVPSARLLGKRRA
jgi:hypothetical protein